MARKRVEDEVKASKDQQTNPGIWVSSGVVEQSDYDNENDYYTLQKDYTDMTNGDPVVDASISTITYPILNSDVSIEPKGLGEDKPTQLAVEVADYCRSVWDNLSGSTTDLLIHALDGYWHGFVMFEKCYGLFNFKGKMNRAIVKLSPIQHDTIHRFNYDDKLNFLGIEQYRRSPDKGETFVSIDADKLIVFTPFKKYGNVQGESILRPARRAWKDKNSLLSSSVRAASRGAGIPVFTQTLTGDSTIDASINSSIKTMGRTVGNLEKAYVVEQRRVGKDDKELPVVTFRLESLANQEHNIELIDRCDKWIMYSTLSYFMASGIGENGSRAATEEHKSPYLESLNANIKIIEQQIFDVFIEDTIENSVYFGRITPEEYPAMKLSRPKESDLERAIANLLSAMSAHMITWTPKDEARVREMLGMDELSIQEIEEKEKPKDNVETDEPEDKPESDNPEVETEKEPDGKEPATEMGKKLMAKIGAMELSKIPVEKDRLTIIERDIFELDNAARVMGRTEDKARATVEAIYAKILADVVKQLEKNPNKAPELRYRGELQSELLKIYNEAYEDGYEDVFKEADKTRGMKLANPPQVKISGSVKGLNVFIDAFFGALDSSIKKIQATSNMEQVVNEGGIADFFYNRLEDSNKTVQTDLIAYTRNGYTGGRADGIAAVEKETPMRYLYTTALEKETVCEVCFPLDKMTMTWEQANQLGLNMTGAPLNPNCLGRENCRCQLIPFAGVESVVK